MAAEQVHRRPGLLEAGPEQSGAEKQQEDDEHPVPFGPVVAGERDDVGEIQHRDDNEDNAGRLRKADDRERQDAGRHETRHARDDGRRDSEPDAELLFRDADLPRFGRLAREFSGPSQVRRSADVHDEANGHPDTRQAEADVPVHVFGEIAADQRTERRADVDAHVEDRKTGIAPRRRVVGVQVADDGADVGLKESRTDDDEQQPQVERPDLGAGYDDGRGQREVAGRDDDAAQEHGLPLADDAVGDPAAGERERVNAEGVQAVDCTADLGAHREAARGAGHVENQDRPHTVVAEAFPEFHGKQGHQAPGVAESRIGRLRRRRARRCHRCSLFE